MRQVAGIISGTCFAHGHGMTAGWLDFLLVIYYSNREGRDRRNGLPGCTGKEI